VGTDSASHLEDRRYHRQAGRQAYRQAGACKRRAWQGMGIVAGHGSAGQGRDGHNGSAYDRAWKRRAGDIGHGERNSRVWKVWKGITCHTDSPGNTDQRTNNKGQHHCEATQVLAVCTLYTRRLLVRKIAGEK